MRCFPASCSGWKTMPSFKNARLSEDILRELTAIFREGCFTFPMLRVA